MRKILQKFCKYQPQSTTNHVQTFWGSCKIFQGKTIYSAYNFINIPTNLYKWKNGDCEQTPETVETFQKHLFGAFHQPIYNYS